jgi:hypothetical protein
MNSHLSFVRALVRTVLMDDSREWTVQGFGFLRTYFGPPDNPKRFRLNLWNSDFTVPNVSTIHDHPWDFTSLVVAGEMENRRYYMRREPVAGVSLRAPTHSYTTIRTGVGGGLIKAEPQHCVLVPFSRESYSPGDTYAQRASEIHETKFKDGSITLNERIGDTEMARVFWPFGTSWVDAIPRPATQFEVDRTVNASLVEWF